jgi:hypothetical protein
MQASGIMQNGVTPHDRFLLRRFLGKLVIDVLPAALTSVIGGFLVMQYQFNHAATLRPAAEQAAPASAEMVQLVRDEHTAIMDYLKAQIAAEKSRNAAADAADARAVADVQTAAAASTSAPVRDVSTVVATAKPVAPRSKAVAAAVLPPHAPLVIAQAGPDAGAAPVQPPAPQSKSLLARTLDIKDHVVGATLHAVSAIGGIPSWIASMGDRLSGADTTSSSAGRLFTTSS